MSAGDQRPATMGDIQTVYGDINKLRETMQAVGEKLATVGEKLSVQADISRRHSADIIKTNETATKLLQVIQVCAHRSPCAPSKELAEDLAEHIKESQPPCDPLLDLSSDFKKHIDETKQTYVEQREEQKVNKRTWQERLWKPVETLLGFMAIALLLTLLGRFGVALPGGDQYPGGAKDHKGGIEHDAHLQAPSQRNTK